jgi:hypothetical protein
MTEPNGTNGHPPSKPPDPEPRNKLTYRLFVEATDESGGTREVWEPDELLLGSLGWVRAETASDIAMAFAKAGEEQVAAMAKGMAGALGVAPSVPEASDKAGGKMPKPSEWIREWCAQSFPALANDSQRRDAEIAGIVKYLDEQWRERGGG